MSATIYPAETNRNKVTSYIPLTSPWPSSSGCASLFRQNGPSLMAWAPGYGLDIDTKVSCNPPAVTTWWDQERLGGGGRYETRVSIGPLTCPSYFHTVVTSIKDGYSTLAMCCPSGYHLANGIEGYVAGDCLSEVSSGMVLTYASTSKFAPTVWETATTTLTTGSTVGAIAIKGWNIEFPSSTSITLTEMTSQGVTSTDNASFSGDSQDAASHATPEVPSADGLTLDAKVGIGVGVGVGAIGVIALVAALIVFRRNRRLKIAHQPQNSVNQTASMSYQHSLMREPPGKPRINELPGHSKHGTWTSPAELGVSQ